MNPCRGVLLKAAQPDVTLLQLKSYGRSGQTGSTGARHLWWLRRRVYV